MLSSGPQGDLKVSLRHPVLVAPECAARPPPFWMSFFPCVFCIWQRLAHPSDLRSPFLQEAPPTSLGCALCCPHRDSQYTPTPAPNLIPSCQESQPLESKWPVFTSLAALDCVLRLRALSRCSANASGTNDVGVTGTEPIPGCGWSRATSAGSRCHAAVRAWD